MAELGLGTGLNVLAAWQHFLQHAPPTARLQWISFEHAPLQRHDLQQALSQVPEIATLYHEWVDAMPHEPVEGFHTLYLFNGRLRVLLWLGDARQGLRQLKFGGTEHQGGVDGWLMDGFAPKLNPDMWASEVLQPMSQHSRPGARIATFTVARKVRDGLERTRFPT